MDKLSPNEQTASFLHMLTLPKDENGDVHHTGIYFSEGINPDQDRMFITAKGMLFLEKQSAKVKEKLSSFIVTISVDVLVAAVSAWLAGSVSLS